MYGSLVFCSRFRILCAAAASPASNFFAEKIAALPEKIAAGDEPPH
jgi:hypothetical protein